jgi:hypothetical protein
MKTARINILKSNVNIVAVSSSMIRRTSASGRGIPKDLFIARNAIGPCGMILKNTPALLLKKSRKNSFLSKMDFAP